MKPFYWGIILASVIMAASIWLLGFGNPLNKASAPASIQGFVPSLEEKQKPEIPELDSFKGLEQELNSLDKNSAPLKN